MNCCHENDEKKENKVSHGPMKHMLLMVLCCGLPILLIAVLPFLTLGTGFKVGLASIIPFLCPLMMLFMIPMMLKGSKDGKASCHDNKQKQL